MVQRCGRVCFLLESAEAIGIGRERGGQHLDRDVAPKSRIAGAIDLAHAARADLGGNLIHPEAGARCEGHAGNRRDYTGLPRCVAISREKRRSPQPLPRGSVVCCRLLRIVSFRVHL